MSVSQSPKPNKAPHLRSDVGRYAMLPEWLLTTNVSDKAIRLFGVLAAKYADRDGVAYPSRNRLAQDLGLAFAKSVDAPLRELESVGALAITKRRDESGAQLANTYTLSFSKPAAGGVLEQGPPSPENTTGGVPFYGQGSPSAGTTPVPQNPLTPVPENGHDPDKYLTRSIEPERDDADASLFPRPTPTDLVTHWNTHREPGPKVSQLTAPRRRAYGRALDANPDLDDWTAAIVWLNRQAYANAPGTGAYPTWRADLDWLAKPGQLAPVLDKARADAVAPPRRPRRPGDVPTDNLTPVEIDAKSERQRRANEFHEQQEALKADAANHVLAMSDRARAVIERLALTELEPYRVRVSASRFDEMVCQALPLELIKHADGRPLAAVVAELEGKVVAA